MKRSLLCALLALLFLFASAGAENSRQALYTARLTRDTTMRAEPSSDAERVCGVEVDADVYVYTWREDWSYCSYGKDSGWLPSDRLYEIAPLGDTDVPGYLRCRGLAVMEDDALLALDSFGTAVWTGDRVAMADEDGLIPMMRGSVRMDSSLYSYTPFVSVEEAEPGDVIAAYTTWYNSKTGGKLAKNRKYNIELAVSLADGRVIQPDAAFSFNRICGPYTTGKGYREAPNISRSGVGPGGGVCQLSTTLYEAILPTALTVEEWHVHRASGIPYAPVSLDCAVGTGRDFIFRNTLPWPIRINAYVQGGSLTVTISRAE